MAKNNLTARIGRVLAKTGMALVGKSTLNDIRNEFSMSSGTSRHLRDFRVSAGSFFTIYRSHGDVAACVREISESVGIAGHDWVNASDLSQEANAQDVARAEEVLNKNRPWRRFKGKLLQYAAITGNGYVHIEFNLSKQPIGVNFIDPRQMYVVTDQFGDVIRWIQKKRNGAEIVEFEPHEIAHFKFQDDPDSAVFGLSPLEPVIWEVRTDLAAMTSNYVFFENDAIPAAQYILDEELTVEEQKRAIRQLEEQVKGADKRHRSIAVQGVRDIKQLSVTAKDMEFHVLRRFTTEKVCAMYGVPKTVLNYTDSVNYANGKEQTQKFWEGTVEPLEQALAEFVNKELLPKLGITSIELEFRPRNFDNREWNEESSRRDIEHGIITINEAREARGLEPFSSSEHGEFVDKPLMRIGIGALEDLGLGNEDFSDEDTVDETIKKVKEFANRQAYGQKTHAE